MHDHGSHAPRLLSVVESAVEAEHLANELLRLKLGAQVAGPEQPPAEDSWDQALHLGADGRLWWVALAHGGSWRFPLTAIDELTSVDWSAPGFSERGVLLRAKALDRSVFLRAAEHPPTGGSHLDLTLLLAFLEACGLDLPPEARVRHQRLVARNFGAPTLEGDLLPLALGVVDALDDRPGELPHRPSRS